jgi:hypothetical protein
MTLPYFCTFVITRPFLQEWFLLSLIEIGQMFHFKTFLPIITHIKFVSLLWPLPTPGDQNLKGQAWICTKSGSFHVNLSYFGSTVLVKKKFSMTSTYLYTFVIISPLKRPGPLFIQFSISFTQGWFCTKFDWYELFWLSASWEEDF